MTSPIQVLPDSLISMFAAGEVVDRPASVIKELVENALDAGANELLIETEKGGRSLLWLSDNGSGMTAEDLRFAILRHATSKIHDEKDLFGIRSLGFRGEALAAIASVSSLRIESRKADQEVGHFIELEGGTIVKEGKVSVPVGTRVQIRQLFYNTPARLKFLKSPETEALHIFDLLQAYALAYPTVGFRLKKDGKEELSTLRGESIEERLHSLFGQDLAAHLFPFGNGGGAIEISGFCSAPALTSSTTRSLFYFVNGRLVKDRTLQHAVLSAYENLLMRGRFPWVVLYLKIPFGEVDVNVHPTKAEVRLTNGSAVHDAVRRVVRRTLEEQPWRQVGAIHPTGTSSGRELPLQKQDLNYFPPPLMGEGEGEGDPMVTLPLIPSHQGRGAQFQFSQTPHSALRVLGQVHGTYLVCDSDGALVLIDQHAAHERIGFERLKKQFEEGGLKSQRLLIPLTVDFQPSETALLKKYGDELHTFGLEVDFFGGNTFVIRSTPSLLGSIDYKLLMDDLVREIASFDKLTPLRERFREVLERIACHRQVRAGDSLSHPEMMALLKDLEGIPFSSNCPHGRPVAIEIPWTNLEKGFRRRL